MTSQPGLQIIAIHILLNITQRKCNQKMKFGQLTEYNKRNIFFQKLCGKWGKETNSGPLFILYKVYYEGKTSGLHLSFDILPQPSTCHKIKANCIKL